MVRVIPFSLLALALMAPALAAQEIKVTRDDCAGLVNHVPDAGVAYQSGVDANGNQVASADLGGGFSYEAPTDFSFNVTINPIDYQRRRNLEANRAALAAEQSAAAATAETLETAAATLQDTTESLATAEASLEAEDAAVLVTFEAASQVIRRRHGRDCPDGGPAHRPRGAARPAPHQHLRRPHLHGPAGARRPQRAVPGHQRVRYRRQRIVPGHQQRHRPFAGPG